MGDRVYQQCLEQYLSEHVNNPLSFTVTREMVSRSTTRSILYGLHSLDAPPSVDEFKFRMGYTAKPVRQRVVFHSQIAPFISPFTHQIVRKLTTIFQGNPLLAKTEGMLRFYLQGRKPLQEQQWPIALSELKDR